MKGYSPQRHRDTERKKDLTRRRGDAETQRRRDAETQRRGDNEDSPQRHRDTERKNEMQVMTENSYETLCLCVSVVKKYL